MAWWLGFWAFTAKAQVQCLARWRVAKKKNNTVLGQPDIHCKKQTSAAHHT